MVHPTNVTNILTYVTASLFFLHAQTAGSILIQLRIVVATNLDYH